MDHAFSSSSSSSASAAASAAAAAAASLVRKSHDALPQSQYRTAAGLASVLTSALQSMLAEADAYSALFEARIKHEENFMLALRNAIDKQNEVDVKAEAKSPSAYMALFAAGSATLRATWREFRDNQTREIEMRQSLVDSLKTNVVAPLQSFRESQERIRRRVKEDLKASMADYDQMRDHTLPRLRKTYEKKCEQLEQLRGQQQAIDDQRALLSQPSSAMQVPTMSTLRDYASPSTTAVGGASEADDLPSAPGMAQTTSQSSAPEHRTYASSTSEPSAAAAGLQTTRSDINLSTSPSSPPLNLEKTKLSLREALRTKEGREAAIKDAPKKLQGFINRMREGSSDRHSAPGGAGMRDRDGSEGPVGMGGGAGGVGGSTVGGGGGGGGGGIGSTFENAAAGLVRGASAAKTIQNIALRVVQVKKESEDADRAYRKAVFDLETLRIRRSKTLSAAVTSVVECRRELNRTAQTVLLQAERAALSTAHSAVSVHDRTEEIVERAIGPMAIEAVELESGLTAVMQDDEEPVPYINFWHGRAQVIFGISLTDYAFSHQRGRIIQPPTIVMKCISYIEAHGLEQQGIYRISARHSAIQALLAAVEKDEEGLDLEALKPDLPAVAGLLKLYLRELPEPVMSMPWEERIKYTHERDEHIRSGFSTLKGRIRRLPAINNVTLKAIIFHLANVAAHADKNSMNESNLAVIFGPVLLSEADHETTSLAAAMEEDRVVEDLIRHAPQIFDAGPVDPNVTAITTATMAHGGVTLVTSGPDGSPAIAIPAVPLSASLPGLAGASSVSDQPLLPGAAGLKRSNAIVPGDSTVSPPRRELHLQPHAGAAAMSLARPGAPLLPPVQTSPMAPLDLDPMEQMAAQAAIADSSSSSLSSSAVLRPEESPGLAAAVQYNASPLLHSADADANAADADDADSAQLVSRSSTVRQPPGASYQQQRDAPAHLRSQSRSGSGSENGAPGLGSSSQYASPIGHSASSAGPSTAKPWATEGMRSGSTSSASSMGGMGAGVAGAGVLNPWADRARGASGESAPSPSSASNSSGFSVPRPLPVPAPAPAPISQFQPPGATAAVPITAEPQAMSAAALATSGEIEPSAGPEGSVRMPGASPFGPSDSDPKPTAVAAPYPPPVSELIFTRPPPPPQTLSSNSNFSSGLGMSTTTTTTTTAAAAAARPPLPPRPIPLNAPVPRDSGEVGVDALTAVELQRE
ncbi:hypothetical protein OC834_000130 [Tilletia horrida]|nr:hypothetical protein OC834_000130 [Tilletia horrida]